MLTGLIPFNGALFIHFSFIRSRYATTTANQIIADFFSLCIPCCEMSVVCGQANLKQTKILHRLHPNSLLLFIDLRMHYALINSLQNKGKTMPLLVFVSTLANLLSLCCKSSLCFFCKKHNENEAYREPSTFFFTHYI